MCVHLQQMRAVAKARSALHPKGCECLLCRAPSLLDAGDTLLMKMRPPKSQDEQEGLGEGSGGGGGGERGRAARAELLAGVAGSTDLFGEKVMDAAVARSAGDSFGRKAMESPVRRGAAPAGVLAAVRATTPAAGAQRSPVAQSSNIVQPNSSHLLPPRNELLYRPARNEMLYRPTSSRGKRSILSSIVAITQAPPSSSLQSCFNSRSNTMSADQEGAAGERSPLVITANSTCAVTSPTTPTNIDSCKISSRASSGASGYSSPGREGRKETNEETSGMPQSDKRRIANRRGEGKIFNGTPKRSLSADRSSGRPSFDDAASPFVNDLLPGRDSNVVYGNEEATGATDMPGGKEEESGAGDRDGQGGKGADQGWPRYDGVSRVFQGFQGLSQYQYKTDSPNLSQPRKDALCGNLRPRQLSVSRGVIAGVTAHTMSEPSSSPFSRLKMNAKFDSPRSCGPPRYEGCFWMYENTCI